MSKYEVFNTDTHHIRCPECGEEVHLFSISKLFIDLLDGKSVPEALGKGFNRAKIIRMISPPSIPRKDLISSIHPDFLLTLIVIIGLYSIVTQPKVIALIAIGLILITGIYVVMRKRILARFNGNNQQREAEARDISSAVDIWMELYFCPKNDFVFHPDRPFRYSLEKLQEELMHLEGN